MPMQCFNFQVVCQAACVPESALISCLQKMLKFVPWM